MSSETEATLARIFAQIVAQVRTGQAPLAIVGGRSHWGWGQAYGIGAPTGTEISTSALSGILKYEPEELVISAWAGTPITTVNAALAAHNQCLAFDPPTLSPLFGSAHHNPTLGGVLALNLSGSGRIKAGAARDHLLGVEVITGRGEVIKSGGRVVKNVTGYDLPKLMAGSRGSLGVLIKVTLKTMPAPDTSMSLCAQARTPAAAQKIMARAFSSVPAALAWLPMLEQVVIRFQGTPQATASRCARMAEALKVPCDAVEGAEAALWQSIRDAHMMRAVAREGGSVWRIVLPPAAMPAYLDGLKLPSSCLWFCDWGGGLLWLGCPDGTPDVPGASGVPDGATIRRGLVPCGGHATLMVRALGETAPTWHPLPPAVAALSQRIRDAFDPLRLFQAPGDTFSADAPGAPGAPDDDGGP